MMEYRKSLTAYKYCVIIIGFFHVIPFKWKKDSFKRGNLPVQQSKISVIFIASTCWLALDMMYLSIVLYHTIKNFDGNIPNTLSLMQHTLSRGGCLVSHFVNLWKTESKAEFITQFYQVDKIFREKFPNLLKEEGHGSRIIWVLTMLAIFQPLGPVMAYLKERHSNRYWPSKVLPLEIYDSISGIIFFAFLEFRISAFAVGVACYNASFMLLYISSNLHYLQQLIRYDTDGNEEKQNNARLYTILKLLNISFNKCYSVWWALCNLLLFINHVAISATLLRCRELMPLSYYTFLIIAITATLWFEKNVMGAGGILYAESHAVIQSYKRSPDDIQRRYFVSCRHMSINVGSLYFLEPATGLKFMALAVENTINVLLVI